MVGKCTTIDQCTNLGQLQVSDVASEVSNQFMMFFHISNYSVKLVALLGPLDLIKYTFRYNN